MSFQIIDIIFIVIMLVVGFTGLKKGFFSQVVTILGVILGLFVAYSQSDKLAVKLSEFIGKHDWNVLLAFILIFVGIILFSVIINKLLKDSLEQLGTEGLDKILGFSFGLIQGLIICIGITYLLTVQPLFDPEPIFEDSIIGSKIVEVLPRLEKIIPEAEEYLNEFDIDVPDADKIKDEIEDVLDNKIPTAKEILDKIGSDKK
ncbi:MAG: CvpA family protein [Spirochaetaceae bacterium]